MKNKTRKMTSIVCVTLLIVLIQAIGITYAKYIAGENAIGKAEVAKWGFEIVKEGEQIKTIDLASTVNKETLVNGKIAPGTSGAIKIALDGLNSEVDLDYKIEFVNEKNKPNNLIFGYQGKGYSRLSDLVIDGDIKYYEENRKDEIMITWSWNYETGKTPEEIVANDRIDTADANTIEQYTFDIIVTATQSE